MGNWSEAVEWAKEVVECVTTLHPRYLTQLFALRYATGPHDMLYFVTDYKDPADVERVHHQRWREDKYRELMRKARKLLVDGSVTSMTMVSLE